ncbi:hypothetical protein ACOBQB_29205 [Streptomyces sp. G5(2025)]|uniref:hypothetical protein n=1 Tax=Streptomyces sp. G5(2025) TaxID=3406628 RepID=UPI003C1765BA
MRATRRTFRTAAIATGAIAAFTVVPATAAFAADTPNTPVTPPTNSTDATTGTATGTATGTDTNTDAPKPDDERVHVRDVKLADGSLAKVYKLGPHHYQADIIAHGTKLDTLDANGNPARGENNGLHVILNPDGTLKSWVEDAKPKPTPDDKRVHVRDVKLADGSLAKVYKLGPHHYQADIIAHGTKLDTLDANGNPARGENNGLHVILNPDGTLKSWVEGGTRHGEAAKPKPASKPQSASKPQPQNGSHRVVPKGGVKAGAEGVTAGSPDEAPLIAAGGGMAALGAAGLGFAVYRRRHDG